MNEYLSRLLGVIDVNEKGGNIIITGLPADNIVSDIYRLWRTSKIAGHMFAFQGKSKIVMPSFFGLEFLYMLNQIKKANTGKTTLRTINTLKRELLEKTWLGKIDTKCPPILNRSRLSLFNVAPLKHQTDFFNAYEDITPRYGLNGYVVAMGVGTGKTLAALMLQECLELDYIIIVPPARAIHTVWLDTFNSRYKNPPEVWYAASGKPLPVKASRYTIFHYESLEYAVSCVGAFKGKRVGIVLDESHNMNELSAERTNLFLEFVNQLKPVAVNWLSATPIKALGSEMIPMLRSFDPLFTPDVQLRFKNIFGKNSTKGTDIINNRMGVVSYKVEVVKSKPIFENLPIEIPNASKFTLDVLRDDMLRFIKERMNYYKVNFKSYQDLYDRCLDLHAKTLKSKEDFDRFKEYTQGVAMIRKGYDPATMVQIAYYCNRYELNEIMSTLPQNLRAQFKDCRSVIKYVDLKVRGECLGRIVGRRRTEAVLAVIPHAKLPDIIRSAEKKTVLFTSYVEAVELAETIVRKTGLNPLIVHGGTNANLAAIINEFNTNPTANPMIATYQSLSTAVPLVAANTMVALNLPFRDHDFEQAVGRIDRINQDAQTEVFSLILDTGKAANISSRTLDILNWSKEQVDAIMGRKDVNLVELSLESIGVDFTTTEYGIHVPVFSQVAKKAIW